MNKSKFTLIAASLMLAMAFIISCSSNDGGGDEPEVGALSSGDTEEQSSSSDGDLPSSSSFVPSGTPVSKSKITGVSHKGPFIIGSTVTLYELDESLSQTGRTFTSDIIDSKGSFEIKNIELVSSYARLEVNGFYLNERTGNKSNAPITLKAVVDLANKDKINVNILTHLEYNRVMYLIENGKSFAEAKEQAQQEVFAVFGIDGNFINSEDMSIFDANESSAALLAISVLLLNKNSDANFSELLTKVALGIQNTGEWEGAAEKKDIADWASEASLYADDWMGNGTLKRIRDNILKWELSSEVPDFEKHVRSFWYENYGLGVCNANSEGVIKNNANETSVNKDVYYICENEEWIPATENDIYKNDTYGWGACSTEGEFKDGLVTGNKYICDNTSWREASYKEVYCLEHSCQYFTDVRDNQRYTYVVIGEQTWMAENLNYKTDNSWCYDNNEANCEIYGRLYDWEAAMIVCPSGWHLPTNEEWDALIETVGNEETAGVKLKSTSGWNDDGNGTDNYGFSALPGGQGDDDSFGNVNLDGMWWSYSDNNGYIYNLTINYGYDGVNMFYGYAYTGFSIRCVKD